MQETILEDQEHTIGKKSLTGRFVISADMIHTMGPQGTRAFCETQLLEIMREKGGNEPEGFRLYEDSSPRWECKCCRGLVHIAFVGRLYAYMSRGYALKEPVRVD